MTKYETTVVFPKFDPDLLEQYSSMGLLLSLLENVPVFEAGDTIHVTITVTKKTPQGERDE